MTYTDTDRFPFVILAGGLGSRMQHINGALPKALTVVCGKPFIFYQLEWLKKHQYSNVTICVGFNASAIVDAVGNGERFGLNIKYIDDGETLLGTGGALKKALRAIKERNFFILYGDTFLPIDFYKMEYAKRELNNHNNMMAVFKNSKKLDLSNVEIDGSLVKLYDKHNPNANMEYIDYGVSIINRMAFQNFKAQPNFDLADFYRYSSINKTLNAYEVKTRFYEIGSPAGLKDTKRFIQQNFGHKPL